MINQKNYAKIVIIAIEIGKIHGVLILVQYERDRKEKIKSEFVKIKLFLLKNNCF